ncbi:MAG: strictosidine synthase [Notoacmeibacter sp.]|nr:strictosidine synthase [Notoacmeibacter sp.]
MISAVRRSLDRFLGRGEASITVPVMDGPFRPNSLLETAPVLRELPDIDNIVRFAGDLLCSCGDSLVRLPEEPSGESQIMDRLPAPVTCLASGSGDALAVGLDGKGILIRGGKHDGLFIGTANGQPLNCPSASFFVDDDTLVVANGSAHRPMADWKADLMDLGSSGSVLRIDLPTGNAKCLASGLAFPNGLALAMDGAVIVTEAWHHRILRIGNATPTVLAENLPGYPGRIVRASSGGYWLAFFAVRNQLIEFVLRERAYCREMMEAVPSQYWIAPDLRSGGSFSEPLQGGAVKQMGILKPWAPTRSYGLVVRCDESMRVVSSYHSRAGGRMHGVTALCDDSGGVLVAVKGDGKIVRLSETGKALS